jgi:hypothetical protein
MGTIWLNDASRSSAGWRAPTGAALRGIPARNYAMGGIELAYWPLSRTAVPVRFRDSPLVKSFEHRAERRGFRKIIIRVGGVETGRRHG